jgi:hypothetical protein
MLPDTFKKDYISYEEAGKDSLSFRSGSMRFTEELDEFVGWFSALAKILKTYGEEYSSE